MDMGAMVFWDLRQLFYKWVRRLFFAWEEKEEHQTILPFDPFSCRNSWANKPETNLSLNVLNFPVDSMKRKNATF